MCEKMASYQCLNQPWAQRDSVAPREHKPLWRLKRGYWVFPPPHSLLAHYINYVSVLLLVFTFVPLVTDKRTTGKNDQVLVRPTEKRNSLTLYSMTNPLCDGKIPFINKKKSMFTKTKVGGNIWHLRNRVRLHSRFDLCRLPSRVV